MTQKGAERLRSELERLKKLWSGVPVGSLAAASTPVAGAAPAAKTR